jgi:hypothetical protein
VQLGIFKNKDSKKSRFSVKERAAFSMVKIFMA